MRSGRLAVLTGAACLAAACGAPAAGVTGMSASTTPVAATSTPTGAEEISPPPGDPPVLIPPPKVSPYTYVFPVQGCKVSYRRKLLVLPKTTIWAKKGCAFVSPVDGEVREVNTTDRWSPATDRGPDREGRFVTILGVDGVLYLGGHLDTVDPKVRPGLKVKAGDRLGTVGNSGNARNTASNLYFAISWPAPPEYWWIRRGMVKPWPYLEAWEKGNRTYSPREEMLALRKRLGNLPPCTKLCGSAQTGGGGGSSRPQPNPRPTPTKKAAKKSPEPVVIDDVN
ncbi:M23 family metallopeptidase [Thermobispora bispora]|uniref:M23 family metallopeptidase n=1 Tax=Thermobispora bispora TaxID=2006 RepID=UPI0011D24EA1|nr:M23 family metallopeptidase [Thermobispora bispora]MDI9579452.1 M23 family metallopeptidase [Thermobispora sp.]